MTRARAARVYTPPPETPPSAPPPLHDDEGGRPLMLLAIMLIVIVLGGYALWSIYGNEGAPAGDIPVVAAPEGYKERYKEDAADDLATAEIDRALAGERDAPKAPKSVAAVVEEPLPVTAKSAAKTVAAVPASRPMAAAAAGGFLAQVASLKSAGAADTAWNRLAARDPALFAGAQKDVQQADLGEKGVYFRVRAGYFAERAEAQRFCERVKSLGQDCIVVAR